METDACFFDGGARRLRHLLQHLPLPVHCNANGAAVAAFEKFEPAEYRRESPDAGGRIQCAPEYATNTFAVDPNLRVGYAQTWQLSVQVDLPRSLQLTATYQGIKGTHALQEFLPNTYPTGAVNPCPSCPSGFIYMTSNGNSTRESGTLQLRRRLHSGFTATMQYTFSKSIDDAALGGRGQSSAVVIAQDWLNPEQRAGAFEFRSTACWSIFRSVHVWNGHRRRNDGQGMERRSV